MKTFEELSKLLLTDVAYILAKCEASPEMFTHYAMMVSMLGKCYTHADNNAVIIAEINGDMAIMSVNATEMQVTKLMNESNEYLMAKVMADAPEKSMFN
jgi:hypothetical protein